VTEYRPYLQYDTHKDVTVEMQISVIMYRILVTLRMFISMDVDLTGYCACKERKRYVVKNYDMVVSSAVS
jgi:hypothetical protein